MSLTEAPSSENLMVIEINSGLEAKRRLFNLGIQSGDMLKKENTTKWGPILVQNITSQAGKVAIGRSLASNIIVEMA